MESINSKLLLIFWTFQSEKKQWKWHFTSILSDAEMRSRNAANQVVAYQFRPLTVQTLSAQEICRFPSLQCQTLSDSKLYRIPPLHGQTLSDSKPYRIPSLHVMKHKLMIRDTGFVHGLDISFPICQRWFICVAGLGLQLEIVLKSCI